MIGLFLSVMLGPVSSRSEYRANSLLQTAFHGYAGCAEMATVRIVLGSTGVVVTSRSWSLIVFEDLQLSQFLRSPGTVNASVPQFRPVSV